MALSVLPFVYPPAVGAVSSFTELRASPTGSRNNHSPKPSLDVVPQAVLNAASEAILAAPPPSTCWVDANEPPQFSEGGGGNHWCAAVGASAMSFLGKIVRKTTPGGNSSRPQTALRRSSRRSCST